MARYTEIDSLIEDLRYDIELDARTLADLDFADAKERYLVQLDKDIKQNTISILEQTTTADVRENVHAHWVAINDARHPYRCSNCGSEFDVETMMLRPLWHFCPNCGAQMEANDAEIH